MNLRAIIADDETLSMEMLAILLDEVDPSAMTIKVVATCKTGQETIKAIELLAPDILFLDINMPDGDGMEVSRALRVWESPPPQIVFTTAHAEFAANAFEVEALDYLLKPIKADRLFRALERAAALKQSATPALTEPRIAVPVLGGVEFIDMREIEFVRAQGDYLELRTGARAYMLRKTLSALARETSGILQQTHRSYLVNPTQVVKVLPKAKGEAVLCLASGAEIPVSRSHRRILEALLS